jgi:hypothetical protein
MAQPMPYAVRRCLLCQHSPVDVSTDDRIVTIACPACNAVLSIEFDPPDQPQLRARIERLDESD